MPNWCMNSLYIRGNKKQIKKFKTRAKDKSNDSDLSMDKIVPEPKKADGTESDDWYGWRCDNWGTKWDIDAHLDAEDDEFLEYSFDSAWSPPSTFIVKASKLFKKLSFLLKYEEPGMGFSGLFRAKKGFVVEDQYIESGDFWEEEVEK